MHPHNDNDLAMKMCTKCGAHKSVGEFSKTLRGRLGVASWCKACFAEKSVIYRQVGSAWKDTEFGRRSFKHVDPDGFRTCKKCDQLKPIENYRPTQHGKNGKHSYCTQCEALMSLDRRRKIGTDASRKYGREYYAANREKLAEAARAKTPKDKIDNMVTCGVSRGIKKGSKNGRRSFDLVGYTVDELMAHIEAQFEPWMTWENYGYLTWHIDHIRPLSSFSYETPDDPDFKEAWALSNLRPLAAHLNIAKGAKWDPPAAANDNDTIPRPIFQPKSS
jgi:hypothetical protein